MHNNENIKLAIGLITIILSAINILTYSLNGLTVVLSAVNGESLMYLLGIQAAGVAVSLVGLFAGVKIYKGHPDYFGFFATYFTLIVITALIGFTTELCFKVVYSEVKNGVGTSLYAWYSSAARVIISFASLGLWSYAFIWLKRYKNTK